MIDNLTQPTAKTPLLRESVIETTKKLFRKPRDFHQKDIYNIVMADVEKPLFAATLDYTNGNQSKAALILGISRGTLRKKLKLYGML